MHMITSYMITSVLVIRIRFVIVIHLCQKAYCKPNIISKCIISYTYNYYVLFCIYQAVRQTNSISLIYPLHSLL